jgi:amino acid adenylation domain-containing protein
LDLGKQPEHAPAVAMSVDNLVYVIYTSGTTGTPKGVANRHRSLCNRLRWGQQRQRLQPDDVVLQKTPFGFDISFWEFFWPLATGAKLVLAGPGEHRDPARLVELVRRHGVTTIHFVPSMLQAFVAEADAANCDSLRRMICSGEALSAELRTAVLNRFAGIDLLNLYGPTEAAIEATCWSCERDNGPTVPIGRPIAQTRTTVLSATLNAVPPGVVGELYLGGVGLARGYLQRPGLTAERFIADPLSNDGGRLYRTGDLVRWNSEGQLDYLGRLDHQVKIHGYRIELGEIESTLLAQPEVREAVVVPRAEQLVAYLVGAAGIVIDCVSIRQRLSGLLPHYMAPSAWVVLEELPLSKLDRKALPEPEYAGAENYEPPQGPMEEALAAIWADALGTQRIGRNDSFFDLGGHSLLLMKVAGRIKTTLRVNLTVADLFEQQSLAGLAARLASLPAMSDDVLARLDTFMDTLESA